MIRLFNRYWSIPAVVSVVVEGGLLVASVWLAFYLRFGEFIKEFTALQVTLRALLYSAVVGVSFYLGGLYTFATHRSFRQVNIQIWRSFVIATVTLWAIYYLLPDLFLGRGVFALSVLFSLIGVTSWRLALKWFLSKHFGTDRVLIVGADEVAQGIAVELLTRKHLGYRVLGFLDNDPELQGVSLVNPRVIGRTDQVQSIAIREGATRIVVARRDFRGWVDMDSLLSCKTSGIPVERGEDYFERITGKLAIAGLRKSTLVFSDGFVVSDAVLFSKRVIDALVACAILLLTAPLMALTALAIRLESRGPVLFSQERVGRHGKVFRVRKFRSMGQDAEAAGAGVWAQAEDPRVTRVGGLLRKTRIDELPQLWNVLNGEMSLVGPRPERPCFVEQLKELSPLYEQRHAVRPGLTGWAQINSGYAASFEASLEKLQYDLFYIKNLSILLDLSIMLSTIKTVLFARGGR